MYVIGLTGGVGSGKSLAAEILAEKYNAELLITDELGHRVMEPGEKCYKEIVAHFGQQILDPDGTISRGCLAERIFQSEEERKWLNERIHPAVIEYVRGYIKQRKEKKGVIVLESALLIESGCDSFCDRIWYVHVSEDVRRERLMESRGYSEEKITSILKRQMSEEAFRHHSDVVIENDGTVDELRKQIERYV